MEKLYIIGLGVSSMLVAICSYKIDKASEHKDIHKMICYGLATLMCAIAMFSSIILCNTEKTPIVQTIEQPTQENQTK